MQVPFGTFSMLDALMDARKKRLMLRFIYATMPFHTGIGCISFAFNPVRWQYIRGRSPICAASTQTFTRKGMDQTSLW